MTKISYTEKLAEDPEMKKLRKAVNLLPSYRVVDGILFSLSIVYNIFALILLFLCTILSFPLLLLSLAFVEKKIVQVGADKRALKALFARACTAKVGYGPDNVSAKLLSQLSLLPELPLFGKAFTVYYFYSNVLGFFLTRRFYIEQFFGLTLGPKVKFHEITYVHMRTCWLDDVLNQFLFDNSGKESQVVILGAGYDTRCLRVKMEENVKAFELDLPVIQNRKLQCYEKLGFMINERAKYIGCNFEQEKWTERLKSNGWNKDIPTCFIFEGNSMYLDRDVIEETMQFIGNQCSNGSIIAFDFVDKEWVDFMKPLMKHDPEQLLRFGLFKGEHEVFLKCAGLNVVEYLEYEHLLKRYIPEAIDGETMGYCIDFGGFVIGRV